MRFVTSARHALAHLRDRLAFDAAFLVRKSGDTWVPLALEGRFAPLHEGAVVPWADTPCARMAAEGRSLVLPRLEARPELARAPFALRAGVGAYAGAPLRSADGGLFGTLCALHPGARPAEAARELGTLELLAELLEALLVAERRTLGDERRADRGEIEHLADPLTGLPGREAWERLLAAEESRCGAYGDAACVASVDLDGLAHVNALEGRERGDLWVRRAAVALRGACREQDIVARVEGDRFAVLGVGCDEEAAAALSRRLAAAVEGVGVAASLGVAVRHPARDLTAAWQEADRAMYARKRERLIHS